MFGRKGHLRICKLCQQPRLRGVHANGGPDEDFNTAGTTMTCSRCDAPDPRLTMDAVVRYIDSTFRALRLEGS